MRHLHETGTFFELPRASVILLVQDVILASGWPRQIFNVVMNTLFRDEKRVILVFLYVITITKTSLFVWDFFLKKTASWSSLKIFFSQRQSLPVKIFPESCSLYSNVFKALLTTSKKQIARQKIFSWKIYVRKNLSFMKSK